jgi:hypothetical protein
MEVTKSKIVYGFSWVAILVTLLVSWLWVYIGVSKDGYAGILFALIGPFLSAAALAFGVIPSSLFYSKKRERRDLISLWVWSISFLVLLGETVAFYCGVFGVLRMA